MNALLLVIACATPVFEPVSTGIELSRSTLTVVRVDPAKRELALVMRSELGGKNQTARSWARAQDLELAVNAGMFDTDGKTGSHLMIGGAHVNNARLRADNAVLAFGRKDESVPRAQIIDREHQDLAELRTHYEVLVQGIRMVDKLGRGRWSKQPKKWSTVAVAVDDKGRVLFLFSRAPHPVHHFIELALGMKLGIVNMMYLEGGPEASLYLRDKLDVFGSYETGFYESDDNDHAWPIPNVIGVRKTP